MSKQELWARLRGLAEMPGDMDEEEAHIYADAALLEYIDDEAITMAFESIPKWYA